MDAQEAIAEADKYPEIRLFTAAKVSSTTPLYELKEVEQSWTIASSSNCLPSDIIFYWVFSCCCAVLVLNSCSCPLVCNFSSKVIMNLNLETAVVRTWEKCQATNTIEVLRSPVLAFIILHWI